MARFGVPEDLLGAVLWRQAGGDQEVQRTADGAWNFGPRMGANLTVGEVVDTFLGTWGGGEWRASPQEDRPHEARLLLLDTRKAEHELAWQATWSASDAVAAAARWYAAWMEGAEPDALRALCRADIAAYCSAAAQTGAWWASSEASA